MPSPTIHPTAIVASGAELGEGVVVGPYAIIEAGAVIGARSRIGPHCMIGGHVRLGEDAHLLSHVVLAGRTTIGARAQIYPFASIGHQPQDLKYKGEPSVLNIGTDCIIREGVTMNPGTAGGGMVTSVGDRCAFLANSHVGHDSRVGNNVIFSNNVMLAGHCIVDDFAIIGGGSAVIQFTRVGAHSFIGGMSALESDLIPYGMAVGNRAKLNGLNVVGLQRRGFSREEIHTLRRAYRLLFADEGTLKERLEDVAATFADNRIVQEIVAYIRADRKKALCTPGAGRQDWTP